MAMQDCSELGTRPLLHVQSRTLQNRIWNENKKKPQHINVIKKSCIYGSNIITLWAKFGSQFRVWHLWSRTTLQEITVLSQHLSTLFQAVANTKPANLSKLCTLDLSTQQKHSTERTGLLGGDPPELHRPFAAARSWGQTGRPRLHRAACWLQNNNSKTWRDGATAGRTSGRPSASRRTRFRSKQWRKLWWWAGWGLSLLMVARTLFSCKGTLRSSSRTLLVSHLVQSRNIQDFFPLPLNI